MNKIMMLSAAVLALTLGAGVAYAENGKPVDPAPGYEGNAGPGGPGKRMNPGLRFFQEMDENGDKVISKAEFVKHAEARFDKMDLDGNGEVTIEEAQKAHEEMRKHRRGGRGGPRGGFGGGQGPEGAPPPPEEMPE